MSFKKGEKIEIIRSTGYRPPRIKIQYYPPLSWRGKVRGSKYPYADLYLDNWWLGNDIDKTELVFIDSEVTKIKQ